MKKIPIALAIATITAGSAHAAIIGYSNEDFEGGTPNYTITGATAPYALTQLQDGVPANITSVTALTNTDYTPGSTSRSGVFANSDVPGTITNEPTGQHGFVSNSSNRNLTLTTGLSLFSDNVQTLTVNFASMVYAFNDGALPTEFEHVAYVTYSASGDFVTDSVLIASYSTAAVGDPGTALNHFTVVEDTWSTLNVSITATDVTGGFTDTAKIRFNKGAPNLTNHMVFYDDIVISGDTAAVPEPTSAVLFGLSGLALLVRRRK